MDRRLKRIITIVEDMMAANAVGQSGGFSNTSDPKGPVAGKHIYLGRGSRKRWMKDRTKKDGNGQSN